MVGFLRRLFRGNSGDESPSPPLLSEDELSRIGTEEDLLKNYEAASERNFRAMEAEQRGEVDLAISLYEQSVAEEFVEAHPYERLANLYERQGKREDALEVTEKFMDLAKSGRVPRGARRSADRKLAEFEARVEKRRVSGVGGPGKRTSCSSEGANAARRGCSDLSRERRSGARRPETERLRITRPGRRRVRRGACGVSFLADHPQRNRA